MDWAVFQAEHKQWLDRNFRGQPIEYACLGIIEESAELLRVLLKVAQERIHGREPRYADKHWGKELVDAVGDCAIYTCSLCNSAGFAFADLVAEPPAEFRPLVFGLAAELVERAVEVYKRKDRRLLLVISVGVYLDLLAEIAAATGASLPQAVATTWEEVRRREKVPC